MRRAAKWLWQRMMEKIGFLFDNSDPKIIIEEILLIGRQGTKERMKKGVQPDLRKAGKAVPQAEDRV